MVTTSIPDSIARLCAAAIAAARTASSPAPRDPADGGPWKAPLQGPATQARGI